MSERQSDGIRPRPKNVHGAFRLCIHYSVRKRCPAGDQCSFPHSEVERIAWEEDRRKGSYPGTEMSCSSQSNGAVYNFKGCTWILSRQYWPHGGAEGDGGWRRDGAVARALPFHHCVPSSIPGPSVLRGPSYENLPLKDGSLIGTWNCEVLIIATLWRFQFRCVLIFPSYFVSCKLLLVC